MVVGNTDTNLYFNRDTKVYLVDGANIWEIPVLSGYAFSQATNTSEITLNEMAAGDGTSRRGRQMFNDSLAPAEWSFDTYARPYIGGTVHAALEEVLWANFVADASATAGAPPAPPTWAPEAVTGPPAIRAPITRVGTTHMDVGFDQSNKVTLGTFDLVFVLGASRQADANYEADGETTIYRVNNCSINEVSITFDIAGISTLSWSGMGSRVREEIPAFDATTTLTPAAVRDSTTNFIRNRMTSIALSRLDANAKTYDITLTGGTITITNNLEYLTPELLGRVNIPLGHTTGTRTVGGSFTAYLDNKTNGTMDLFEDLANATDRVQNRFAVDFYVGGKQSGQDRPVGPGIQFKMPNCHLEVPTHANEDVIGVEVTFSALPSTIGGTDEVSAVRYVGA